MPSWSENGLLYKYKFGVFHGNRMIRMWFIWKIFCLLKRMCVFFSVAQIRNWTDVCSYFLAQLVSICIGFRVLQINFRIKIATHCTWTLFTQSKDWEKKSDSKHSKCLCECKRARFCFVPSFFIHLLNECVFCQIFFSHRAHLMIWIASKYFHCLHWNHLNRTAVK